MGARREHLHHRERVLSVWRPRINSKSIINYNLNPDCSASSAIRQLHSSLGWPGLAARTFTSQSHLQPHLFICLFGCSFIHSFTYYYACHLFFRVGSPSCPAPWTCGSSCTAPLPSPHPRSLHPPRLLLLRSFWPLYLFPLERTLLLWENQLVSIPNLVLMSVQIASLGRTHLKGPASPLPHTEN